MKLKELSESPIKIAAFPEYSDEQLKSAISSFDNAEVVEKIEVDYELLKSGKNYALQKDGKVLGFAITENVEYFSVTYLEVKMLFVLREFRTQNIGTILLHGIKETSDSPLICDDVLTDGGMKLLNSIVRKHADSLFNLKSLNKNTGSISDFSQGDESKKNIALIIENKSVGLFREGMIPGSEEKMYLRFFAV